MKTKALLLLSAVTLLTAKAWAKEPVRVPAPAGVLPVIITEALSDNIGSAFTDFDRLDLALQKVVQERQWPVKIAAEKFAGNTPDYLTERQITLQRVRQETPGEYMYRGWTTVWVNGRKHDLGIITARYNYRLNEQYDSAMEKLFRSAAQATADKIEPLLFPERKTQK